MILEPYFCNNGHFKYKYLIFENAFIFWQFLLCLPLIKCMIKYYCLLIYKHSLYRVNYYLEWRKPYG